MASGKGVFLDAVGVRSFALPDELEELRVLFAAELEQDATLAEHLARAGGAAQGPLASALEALSEGASQALVETAYIDVDFQDEFAAHYARTFRRLSRRCQRIHFFTRSDSDDRDRLLKEIESAIAAYRDGSGGLEQVDELIKRYADLPSVGYRGFVVVRPLLNSPVGRTVSRPPAEVADFVACKARYRSRPLGVPYLVDGFPFISQDGQLATCAHAAIWMIAYYHHQRNGTRRVYMSEIVHAAGLRQEESPGAPGHGISFEAIAAVFREVGLQAIFYRTERPPNDEELPTIICRYLNSALPVLLAFEAHAVVLVGYGEDERGRFFVHHDDQRGLYRKLRWTKRDVGDKTVAVDEYLGEWKAVFIPRPDMIYMTGEDAEDLASTMLTKAREEFRKLKTDERLNDTQLRTYAIQANDYKERLQRRLPESVYKHHLPIEMPKWVWVVEVQDSVEATHKRECVLGEFVIDATADPSTAGVLSANLGQIWFQRESSIAPLNFEVLSETIAAYETGTALHPIRSQV